MQLMHIIVVYVARKRCPLFVLHFLVLTQNIFVFRQTLNATVHTVAKVASTVIC